jgi:hypothetical protein
MTFVLILIILIVVAFFGFFSALNHVDDLAIVRGQQEVIEVYEDRIKSLETRLNSFKYPQSALLNADSPVASIVNSLSEAEKELKANEERAKARRNIIARKAGPFSFVVTIYGEE